MPDIRRGPAQVGAEVRHRGVQGGGLVAGGVHVDVRTFDAERGIPVVVDLLLVVDQRPAGEVDRVGAFIVHGVRPGVRIFKHAVGITGHDVVDRSIQVLQAVLHVGAAVAEEVVLVVEAGAAREVGRPHVPADLAAVGVDVELPAAAFGRIPFDGNLRGHEPVRLAHVSAVRRDVHVRLGVELHDHFRVGNLNEALVLGIQGQVVHAGRPPPAGRSAPCGP